MRKIGVNQLEIMNGGGPGNCVAEGAGCALAAGSVGLARFPQRL
jgi:hypothetical protein